MKRIEKKEILGNIDKDQKIKVAERLLSFANEKKRDFPWRHNQTGYRVLVSELMLQQTQVSRVSEKYEPFLKTFPDLVAVRSAPLSELLLAWKGLGYMRRIKALKQISQGTLTVPKTKEELLTLPGVGEYTAGAVLAFACDTFTPILETNIKTVLCYHFCAQEKDGCVASMRYRELLPLLFTETKLSARNFYEAMMDYGATLKQERVFVCAPVHKQKKFKGSKRELRAKMLYLITEKQEIMTDDIRTDAVLEELVKEGFVVKNPKGYEIAP